MALPWETIIVGCAVGGTAVWAARSIYRSWKKGAVCSSCSDSAHCPLAGKEHELTDLKELGRDHNHHCKS